MASFRDGFYRAYSVMKKSIVIGIAASISIITIIAYVGGFYLVSENNQVGLRAPNQIVITTDKPEYKIGEPVKITMKNVGVNTLEMSSMPVGFTIYDEQDNQMKSWIGPTGMMGEFRPDEVITHVWDQKEDYSNEQVQPGTYRVKPGNVVGFGDQFYEFVVTEQTKSSKTLSDREFPIRIMTDKQVYRAGEPIRITMENISPDPLKTSSTPIGFSIYDANDEGVCT